MRITFLGTGTSQGVPVIACDCDVCQSIDPHDKRLRSSILVESETTKVVIDTGPDFRQQMLRNKVTSLDAVVFTHEHKDHVAGLDDVRAFNFKQKRDMPVFASDRVQEALKREFHYVFATERYPGIPQLELHDINIDTFTIGDLEFMPIKVWHHKLPVLGFRIGDFAYITDANRIEPKELSKLHGLKGLVLNSLRKEDHISHFTLDQAVALMDELKPEEGYLTHISHLMGKHSHVSRELPDYIRIATDGLQISI